METISWQWNTFLCKLSYCSAQKNRPSAKMSKNNRCQLMLPSGCLLTAWLFKGLRARGCAHKLARSTLLVKQAARTISHGLSETEAERSCPSPAGHSAPYTSPGLPWPRNRGQGEGDRGEWKRSPGYVGNSLVFSAMLGQTQFTWYPAPSDHFHTLIGKLRKRWEAADKPTPNPFLPNI